MAGSTLRRFRVETAEWARLAAVVAAVVAVCLLVIGRSLSAFTATTDNSGNTLSSGSVVLTDNDGGSALFNVTGMKPTQSETRCIAVTYEGSITPTVPIKLYGGYVDGPDLNTSADSDLADYLDLVVQIGNPGIKCTDTFAGTAVFSGTMRAFTNSHSGWNNGLSTGWTPTGGSSQTRAFRITATLKDDSNAQAKTAEPSFTWEVRSS